MPGVLLGAGSSQFSPKRGKRSDGSRYLVPLKKPRVRWSEFEIHTDGDGWLVRSIGRDVTPGGVDRVTEWVCGSPGEVLSALTALGWLPHAAREALVAAAQRDHRLRPVVHAAETIDPYR